MKIFEAQEIFLDEINYEEIASHEQKDEIIRILVENIRSKISEKEFI